MSVVDFCKGFFELAVVIFAITTYLHDRKLDKYIKALEENNRTLKSLADKTAELARNLKTLYVADVYKILPDEKVKGENKRRYGNTSGSSESSIRGKAGNSTDKKSSGDSWNDSRHSDNTSPNA